MPRRRLLLIIAATALGAAVARRIVSSRRPRTRPPDLGFMYAMHSAFRRDLERLREVAGSLPGGAPTPPTVLEGWSVFRRQLDSHHHAEDEDLWPMLDVDAEPGTRDLVDTMVREHAGLGRLLDDVDRALVDGGDLASCTDALSEGLLGHLQHEEREMLPVLERHRGGLAPVPTPGAGQPPPPVRQPVTV